MTLDARTRDPKPRGTVCGFPLRGFAVCGSCGGRMTAQQHERFGYYRCCRQAYRRESCKARYSNAAKVHADLEYLCRAVAGPSRGNRSAWSLYERLDDAGRADLMRSVFERVVLAPDGIIDFTLRDRTVERRAA